MTSFVRCIPHSHYDVIYVRTPYRVLIYKDAFCNELVCMSVCLHYLKNHKVQTSRNFLYMLTVTVARSSSDFMTTVSFSSLLFLFFGSVHQIKLAFCQL